ncbi:hypothetical protein SAMN05421823_107247 [Catalinimonas alkaloidigena]|uniref:DUF493 domain-containing protein n=1 Tax=Catalinimonas alkaloidigena TaxID=1075417 RepID=A0A1G9M2T6_9BACT|nr:DUF493 family protein [Catalinimonas alkaloidigena]SDL68579.1 hypothetical protein SAMN05421823_107247 [Catalinimonas alkaloidigena]
MRDTTFDKLQETLEEQFTWPTKYLFKFIVDKDNQQPVLDLFDDAQFKRRPSRNGKYVSLTALVRMPSSDAVIDIYRKAATIKGVITL